MYLAANSPSPCMFSLKIGYLCFSAFNENVSALSVSVVQPLEYRQGPQALCPTIVSETVAWSGHS